MTTINKKAVKWPINTFEHGSRWQLGPASLPCTSAMAWKEEKMHPEKCLVRKTESTRYWGEKILESTLFFFQLSLWKTWYSPSLKEDMSTGNLAVHFFVGYFLLGIKVGRAQKISGTKCSTSLLAFLIFLEMEVENILNLYVTDFFSLSGFWHLLFPAVPGFKRYWVSQLVIIVIQFLRKTTEGGNVHSGFWFQLTVTWFGHCGPRGRQSLTRQVKQSRSAHLKAAVGKQKRVSQEGVRITYVLQPGPTS